MAFIDVNAPIISRWWFPRQMSAEQLKRNAIFRAWLVNVSRATGMRPEEVEKQYENGSIPYDPSFNTPPPTGAGEL